MRRMLCARAKRAPQTSPGQPDKSQNPVPDMGVSDHASRENTSAVDSVPKRFVAIAQEKNCSDITNPQARQECMKHKSSANVDCSAISDSQARRECAQRKQQNSADCSKLATPELRQQC